MIQGQFELPFVFQAFAVFLLAITGATLAIEKKYDFSGVFVLAFIAGAGGSIIRDGIFLNKLPVLVTQWQYIVVIILASIITVIFINYIKRITTFFVAIDALGLGIYGIISAQMAINSNLGILVAIFVGLVGSVSGGFLRDIFTNTEPLLLKPGQYYMIASLAGIVLFILLSIYAGIHAQTAAIAAIVLVFALRMLSYVFNWRTAPAISISQKIFKNGDESK